MASPAAWLGEGEIKNYPLCVLFYIINILLGQRAMDVKILLSIDNLLGIRRTSRHGIVTNDGASNCDNAFWLVAKPPDDGYGNTTELKCHCYTNLHYLIWIHHNFVKFYLLSSHVLVGGMVGYYYNVIICLLFVIMIKCGGFVKNIGLLLFTVEKLYYDKWK